MSHQSELIATDIDAYLAQHERKELVRLLTCGSVDDGKSTLIGRLLHDSKMVYEDQLEAVRKDSVKDGNVGGRVDLSLLVDGLRAEREQGITIDVAYRYFSTAKRKFIVADTPGHEQYTRNMATGASTCDLAIILIDARNGVMQQTKRHSFIASLLGIKHVLVAVNKMDLVDYSEEVFEQIKSDYTSFAARLDVEDLHFIPISALEGDNVVEPSQKMPWHRGATMMHLLENIHVASDRNLIDMRFPVQYVNRPHPDFRGYCGTLASGVIRPGDEVMALPSRKTTRVASIVTYEGELQRAFAPLAVTLTMEDEIDVSRGDMIVHPGNVPRVETQLDAMVVWMSEEPLVPGKPYLIKHTSKTVGGTVSKFRYQIDINTLHRKDASTLGLNEIGRCTLTLTEPISIDSYKQNRATGALVIIDRLTNSTIAAAMILDRKAGDAHRDPWEQQPQSEQLHGEISTVTPAERSERLGQQPATILLTGLSGAGKTTIAYALERRLFDSGHGSCVLDGQNMRLGISKDLGFSADERSENLRRSVEVARLMNDAGLICICAFVAPHEQVRSKARDVIGADRFLLVHLAAPVEVCRERDQEGMYPLADAGQIANFPGVSVKYEEPALPDLVLPTHTWSVDESVDAILRLLRERQVIA